MVHITDFRVIIVGGSSADRALAHSLQRCAIDLVVLEANDNIAHQVGASIGILTTGPGSGINLPLQLKAMSRSQGMLTDLPHMSPNVGHGGNSVVETAASLANEVTRLESGILVKGEFLDFPLLPVRPGQGTMPYVRWG
ncbi:hypothetical protein BDV36DRAFT_295690 [Aspergillus pseudocaelatus]|uniref:Glucose-methanol-choline oxidoreductase N-terminal domain-containing protein n=1 Tax=Aspergillus pseudocaelatus TaxID=1825620 RepID=A0ABQ6WLA6_9EURO|nr:hypothetical protein BDV36DRAFT_295690 [Aspergillus pseudocaelatus]